MCLVSWPSALRLWPSSLTGHRRTLRGTPVAAGGTAGAETDRPPRPPGSPCPSLRVAPLETHFRCELDLARRQGGRERPVGHSAGRVALRVVRERPGAEQVVDVRVVRAV